MVLIENKNDLDVIENVFVLQLPQKLNFNCRNYFRKQEIRLTLCICHEYDIRFFFQKSADSKIRKSRISIDSRKTCTIYYTLQYFTHTLTFCDTFYFDLFILY